MTSAAPKHPEVSVKLTGRDGNAFAVIGSCSRAARKAGLSREEVTEFEAEAMSGDYGHLLRTCMEWFDVS